MKFRPAHIYCAITNEVCDPAAHANSKRTKQAPLPPGMVPGMIPARLTGNVVFDMAFALCIPLMAQGCMTLIDSAKPTLFAFVQRLFTVKSKERFYRTVEYEKVRGDKLRFDRAVASVSRAGGLFSSPGGISSTE